MDHIVDGTLFAVRFIAAPRYDGDGFFTFPARAGWRLEANGRWQTLDARSQDKDELEAFLQSWLFFGVLEEVLGEPVSYDDYTYPAGSGYARHYVHTKHLNRDVEKWGSRIRQKDQEATRQLVHAQLVLDKAYLLVSKYCSVTGTGARPAWDISPDLALSFLILGETLSYAKMKIMSLTKVEVTGWLQYTHYGWGYSELLLEKMQADNWCPFSLCNLLEILQQSVCGQLYAYHLSHAKQLGLDHRTCSDDMCKAREAGSHKICQQSKDRHCRCDAVTVNTEKLVAVLQNDEAPILKYSQADGFVEVIAYKSDLRYAIISHVAVDGFANSTENSIRQCHLNKLLEVFSTFARNDRSRTFTAGPQSVDTPLYFWIDTLTIPLGEGYQDLRRKAMRHTHDMYRNAFFTIVLDMGLMVQPRGRTYADAAMRIATSHWMTRLWTLQEACLSRRLLFVFADIIEDMDDLEDTFPQDLVSPASWAARQYYSALLGPQRALLKQSSTRDLLRGPDFLTSLCNALALRRTAVPQHEPLAIATLLGLDIDQFVNVEFNPTTVSNAADPSLERKMRQLVEMIAKTSDTAIPGGLIFLSKPKLTERGFSWAPATWLKLPKAEYQHLHTIQQAAKLTVKGLEVNFPGIILHRLKPMDRLEENLEDLVFPCDREFKTWILMRIPKWKVQFKDHQIAVVTESAPFRQQWQRAVLVEVLMTIDQTFHSRLLSNAEIRVEQDASTIINLTNTWMKNWPQTYMGELKTDVVWCIDGLPAQQKSAKGRSQTTTVGGIGQLIYNFTSRLSYSRE